MAIKVLFVCVHNSARSQMAEAFLNHIGGDLCEAESAGLEPGTLNPLVVSVMREVGIDISENLTKGAFDLFIQGRTFNAVITVCDQASAERCPIFPGVTKRMNWSFADPSKFTGSEEGKLEQTRVVRDEIKHAVEGLVAEFREQGFHYQ